MELKQIINQTEEFTDKINNVLDWTPAIGGPKGVYDFIKEGAQSSVSGLYPSFLKFEVLPKIYC